MRIAGKLIRSVGSIGAASLAVAGLLVAGASPAEAHHVCSVHRDGSYVCLGSDHQWLIVCDEDVDGNYAYARTYRYGVVQPPLYDQTGAGDGCSLYEARVGSLESFNVCVQNEGCGNPVYRAQF